MKRLIYKQIAASYAEPVEVFWIAGFCRNERNEWMVRTALRGRDSGTIYPHFLPIGMMPVLGLGVWFDRGELKQEGALGEQGAAVVEDLSKFQLITSADVSRELYPLPEGKAGNQRLLRYRVDGGDVIIPAVELIRALFLHNRALALALMRPAGIEQLYYPDAPGLRECARLRFSNEMPSSGLGKQLALEFAWIVFDRQARHSWDSVRRQSADQRHVMFEPPKILRSAWSFRGIRHGNEWFVLNLQELSGRRLPFDELEYSHPEFRKVVRTAVDGSVNKGSASGAKDLTAVPEGLRDEFSVDGDGAGSATYRNPKTIDIGTKRLAFENQIPVRKLSKVLERAAGTATSKGTLPPRLKAKRTKAIEVTTGERADKAKLPPLDFKMLAPAPMAAMGDLDALDEAVRHMRDVLPDVGFEMSLVQLKSGRAVSVVGDQPRSAMIVLIRPGGRSPIALLDIERTGIPALSLMALHFTDGLTAAQVEDAMSRMLGGLVDAGGHWPTEVEKTLEAHCRCERIPKVLVPREKLEELGKYWAIRLMERLGIGPPG